MVILQGDCRERLKTLPEESVQCVITSPPYWGLRDYGYADQIGLEPTPEEYVANMMAVFREVRRVLRDDGTVWLNLGDSYASDFKGSGGPSDKQLSNAGSRYEMSHGLKPKDLCGIPWRVAFALQADGWWLRSDIIWAKPNPMPESVTDRPTRSHEYVFLLSKSARYYYDADAIREPHIDFDRGANGHRAGSVDERPEPGVRTGTMNSVDRGAKREYNPAGRNKRTVWEIPTQPYSEAHFATFPEALVKPCIQAGTSERGQCAECGKPWERVTETVRPPTRETVSAGPVGGHGTLGTKRWDEPIQTKTTGWRPGCAHERHCNTHGFTHSNGDTDCDAFPDPVPQTVLDPFGGSGTVGVVAKRAGRSYILIEASAEYCELAEKRIGPQGVLL